VQVELCDEALGILRNATPAKANGKPAGKTFDVQAMSAWDLWEADVPEPEAIVEGLIFRGLTLLAGRTKIGKSWAALDVAIAVANGTAALGTLAVRAPGGVLFCDLENSRGTTKKRLKHLLGKRTPFLQNLTFARRLPTIKQGGLDILDRMLTEKPAVLVVIDTLAKIVSAEKNRDVVRSEYTEIDRIRQLVEKHHCGVLLVCHTRKAEADYSVDAVLGTTGLTAAADCVLVIKRDGRGGLVLSMTGRDIEAVDYAVDFQDGRWNVRGEAGDTEASEAQQQVLDVFQREGTGSTLTVEQITRLTGRPLPATHVLLHRMVKSGLLTRAGRGKYRASVSLYTERKVMNECL
jgi:hypothetical protein